MLGAEALEHGHERAEVLEAGDGDADRRHHLVADGVVVVGNAGVLEADDEVVRLDRRRVYARA